MTDHITSDKTIAEEIGFDVNALLEQLRDVTDRRQARGIRYSLTFLLGVIILAKLAGQNKPSAIAIWVKLGRLILFASIGELRTVPITGVT